jgi:hypothetical protein
MSVKDWVDEKIGRKWRKLLDQPMHLLWSLIALFPVMFWGPAVLTGALSGLLLALPREFVDQWPIDHWSDTLLDLAFFVLGGALAGFLF